MQNKINDIESFKAVFASLGTKYEELNISMKKHAGETMDKVNQLIRDTRQQNDKIADDVR
jgi:hypothetical protein